MHIFQIHIFALKRSSLKLLEGKYTLYFLPGLFVASIFWFLFRVTEFSENSVSWIDSIPLFGSQLLSGIQGSFDFLKFLLNQILVFFILTILSPLHAVLGEKIESEITGIKQKFDFLELLNNIVRTFFVVGIAIFLEILIMGLYLLVSTFFDLSFIDPIFYFLLSSFFYGFSFYDYSLERAHYNIPSTIGYVFGNIPLVTLSGIIFVLLFQIPFVGIVFAPIFTIIFTTYIYNEQKNVPLKVQNQ